MAAEQSNITFDESRAEAIYTDAMARMYGLVALGIYGWLPDFRIVRILVLIVVIVIAIALLKQLTRPSRRDTSDSEPSSTLCPPASWGCFSHPF